MYMRIHFMTKGRITPKKHKSSLHGGSVQAHSLFKSQGKSALYEMLKPKTLQKYISFS